MGNHRFKLSDMMPNAWFYKLRDMSKLRSHHHHHHKPPPPTQQIKNTPSSPRKSFYFTPSSDNPKFFHPPTKSLSKKRPKRKTIYMPSPRKIAPSDPFFLSPTSPPPHFSESDYADDDSFLDGVPDMSPKLISSPTDIIINVDGVTDFDMISEPDLPPIHTKPAGKPENGVSAVINNASPENPKRKKRNSTSPGSRKSFSGGVRIRGKKTEGRRRKSVKEEKRGMFYTESFAIVKASVDPEKDFRESMVEMIVENSITTSKDLEELLACYLSLNSNQYHDLIIKAFEQIWFSMPQLLHF